MEQTNNTAPQGKGMAVTGFVLALVGLVLEVVVIPMGALVGMWLSYFWLILIIAGTAMSFMGMSKLGKTGGKKGLAITGLVLGLVALVWGIFLIIGTMKAKEGVDALKDNFSTEMQKLQDEAAKAADTTMNAQ
jgi:hypothetical protein